MELKLEAKGQEQTLVKEYLEKNASESLASKINDGVWVEKDGKRLLNKKTLAGFFKYATEEARKQAEKGATMACLHSDTVFGWAIHYFEEDSIIGELLCEDGAPYKATKPKAATSEIKPVVATKPIVQSKPQMSFFDAFDIPEEAVADDPEEEVDEADETAVEEKKEEPSGLSPLFLKYYTYVDKYPNDIIAMRVGDFYEVFGIYAKQVAEVAELTLTSRDVGLPERMEMVGFPYHVKEKYIAKIQKHYAVTVVDSENEIVSYPVQMPEIKVNTETGEVLEEPTHDPELVAIVKRILGEEIEVI